MKNDRSSAWFPACNQPTNCRVPPKEPGHNFVAAGKLLSWANPWFWKEERLGRCHLNSALCYPGMALRGSLIFWALATSEHHLLLLALQDSGVWFSVRSGACTCSGDWEKCEPHPYLPVGSLCQCPVLGSKTDTLYFRGQIPFHCTSHLVSSLFPHHKRGTRISWQRAYSNHCRS